MKLKLGILASGRGSNFFAILKSIESGEFDASIELLISDNKNANALKIAAENNIKNIYIPFDKHNRTKFELKSVKLLKKAKCDLIILAGFLHILSPYFINEFRNRILNIHPSLLPDFKGLNAQKQAIESGTKISGCTVHLVNEELDAGKIILQKKVPLFDTDTPDSLSERILIEEHKLYTEAIKLYWNQINTFNKDW